MLFTYKLQVPCCFGSFRSRTNQKLIKKQQNLYWNAGENLVSGSTCNKVWRVRNDSQQPWPLGAKLVYVSGKAADRLSPQDSYPVSVALAPGQEADISVEIVAPAAPGKYEAFWRLQGPKGKKFGQRLGCSILVRSPDACTLKCCDMCIHLAADALGSMSISKNIVSSQQKRNSPMLILLWNFVLRIPHEQLDHLVYTC